MHHNMFIHKPIKLLSRLVITQTITLSQKTSMNWLVYQDTFVKRAHRLVSAIEQNVQSLVSALKELQPQIQSTIYVSAQSINNIICSFVYKFFRSSSNKF